MSTGPSVRMARTTLWAVGAAAGSCLDLSSREATRDAASPRFRQRRAEATAMAGVIRFFISSIYTVRPAKKLSDSGGKKC